MFQLNPAHTNASALKKPIDLLKSSYGGVSFLGYYIHPNIFNINGPTKNEFITFEKVEKSLPVTSNDPYLVSILDLSSKHIKYLKNLKNDVIDNLKIIWNISRNRPNKIIFSFPLPA